MPEPTRPTKTVARPAVAAPRAIVPNVSSPPKLAAPKLAAPKAVKPAEPARAAAPRVSQPAEPPKPATRARSPERSSQGSVCASEEDVDSEDESEESEDEDEEDDSIVVDSDEEEQRNEKMQQMDGKDPRLSMAEDKFDAEYERLLAQLDAAKASGRLTGGQYTFQQKLLDLEFREMHHMRDLIGGKKY